MQTDTCRHQHLTQTGRPRQGRGVCLSPVLTAQQPDPGQAPQNESTGRKTLRPPSSHTHAHTPVASLSIRLCPPLKEPIDPLICFANRTTTVMQLKPDYSSSQWSGAGKDAQHRKCWRRLCIIPHARISKLGYLSKSSLSGEIQYAYPCSRSQVSKRGREEKGVMKRKDIRLKLKSWNQ